MPTDKLFACKNKSTSSRRNIRVGFQSCLKKSYVASFNNVAWQTVPWLDYTDKKRVFVTVSILANFTCNL